MVVRVLCPAKVNWFLSVGPVNQRGYHPLRTVFQAISLYDELTIQLSDNNATKITCDWSDLPEENTVSRALRYLSEYIAMPPLQIHIKKQIPHQSGLGGGSSDAAGLLRGAIPFLKFRPSDHDLHDIAIAVGADVPFFLVGGRARGEGYGEILTALDDPPTKWLVVARPDVGCPTSLAYKRLDAVPREWRDWDPEDTAYNDFESVAPAECIDIKRQLLEAGASEALLCGSGSAVFGSFDCRETAKAASQVIAAPFVCVAQTCSRKESIQIGKL